jgi:hypothetical protein
VIGVGEEKGRKERRQGGQGGKEEQRGKGERKKIKSPSYSCPSMGIINKKLKGS